MEPVFPVQSLDRELKFRSKQELEIFLGIALGDADLISVVDAEGEEYDIEICVTLRPIID